MSCTHTSVCARSGSTDVFACPRLPPPARNTGPHPTHAARAPRAACSTSTPPHTHRPARPTLCTDTQAPGLCVATLLRAQQHRRYAVHAERLGAPAAAPTRAPGTAAEHATICAGARAHGRLGARARGRLSSAPHQHRAPPQHRCSARHSHRRTWSDAPPGARARLCR